MILPGTGSTEPVPFAAVINIGDVRGINIQMRRFGEKAMPVGIECSVIYKVEKRVFDPAKTIVDPSNNAQDACAAIRRISPDPLQPISFLRITISC